MPGKGDRRTAQRAEQFVEVSARPAFQDRRTCASSSPESPFLVHADSLQCHWAQLGEERRIGPAVVRIAVVQAVRHIGPAVEAVRIDPAVVEEGRLEVVRPAFITSQLSSSGIYIAVPK